jgi:hypothetical protein
MDYIHLCSNYLIDIKQDVRLKIKPHSIVTENNFF